LTWKVAGWCGWQAAYNQTALTTRYIYPVACFALSCVAFCAALCSAPQTSYQLSDADYSGGDLKEAGWCGWRPACKPKRLSQRSALTAPSALCAALPSTLCSALCCASQTSYQLSDADYSGGDLEGGWVVRLAGCLQLQLTWLQPLLTPACWEGLTLLLLDKLLTRLEVLLGRKVRRVCCC
jgi:hypothetical protein